MTLYAVPILAQWDITSGCNFSCSFCLTNSGHRDQNELSLVNACKVIDRLYDGGILFLRILGGEPFFRKDISRVMQYAADKGMLISFSTNASLITNSVAAFIKSIESSLNYFQVSVYGIDKSSYQRITGNPAAFDLIRSGIWNLVNNDLHPYAFWVLTPENIFQLESAYDLTNSMGLPALRISFKLNLGRAQSRNDNIPVPEHNFWQNAMGVFRRLFDKSQNGGTAVQLHARPFLGEYLYKKTGLPYFYITCKAATTMIYIDTRGNASPCPFSKFMPESFGATPEMLRSINILSEDLSTIWDSDVFRLYRELQNRGLGEGVFKKCPHLIAERCNPCIYTPCTCRSTLKDIQDSTDNVADLVYESMSNEHA